MRATRHARSTFLRFAALPLVIVGCNTILDNQRARLEEVVPPDVSGALPSDEAGVISSPGSTPPLDAEAAVSSPCGRDQQLCRGLCVGTSDPFYGCGAVTCTPCTIAHGTASCAGGPCAIRTCDPGYADCNGDASDGCEADLSRATTCGRCGEACPTTAPVCAPSGSTFACSTGCPLVAPVLCGTECVSPLTSVNHCGGCAVACPIVEQATIACTLGVCSFTCKDGYHACAGRCVAVTDPASCGPACAPCPVPPNGVPACREGVCGLECAPGFGDCNGIALDGCETPLAVDPLHCGTCALSCRGGACLAGVCGPPDPAVLP